MIVARFLLENILKPTGRAANIATRVAQGDLSLDRAPTATAGKDALTTSLAAMLDKLRELVGTIRQHAHEAAAMSRADRRLDPADDAPPRRRWPAPPAT